jgi:hypothetical protein
MIHSMRVHCSDWRMRVPGETNKPLLYRIRGHGGIIEALSPLVRNRMECLLKIRTSEYSRT